MGRCFPVRVSALKQTETDIKKDIRTHLGIRRIFNYPISAGPLSHKGLPDRVMHLKEGKYKGVAYLEAKTPKGKLSPYQKQFQEQCLLDGIPYLVTHSVFELEEQLKHLENEGLT